MKKGNKNRRNTPKRINYSSDNQLMTLFKIIIILVIVLGVFYGITLWRTTDKTKTDNKPEEVEIQYDEILIGTILSQNTNEYYVLLADLNAADYTKYESYVETLSGNAKTRLYTSDKESIFNKSYISEEANVKDYIGKTKIDGIKFSDDCLLHIKKVKNKKGDKVAKITEIFVGDEEILKQFSKLVEAK